MLVPNASSIRRSLLFLLVIAVPGIAAARASSSPNVTGPTEREEQRKTDLQRRLCREPQLDCDYVTSILNDPRLVIYEPPPPSPEQPPVKRPRERERNPYLTTRFGLLTPESLERCRSFISAHEAAFDAASEKYGVPREIICGHLRVETDFGIPTKLSPNPLGRRPAINQLVSLYVRSPSGRVSASKFLHRQKFALEETSKLLAAASKSGWDLFATPGSPTGAIGLVQFEPSSFEIAEDGNNDGRIDLFDPDDAIVSIAHYLVTRGWTSNPEHQKRAVYAYYGGHYNQDPHKYYMNAVLKYAHAVRDYLQDHPLQRASL
jgi:membrane-bound lytic murein transglycosylase B